VLLLIALSSPALAAVEAWGSLVDACLQLTGDEWEAGLELIHPRSPYASKKTLPFRSSAINALCISGLLQQVTST
jgi:hypothetical protein